MKKDFERVVRYRRGYNRDPHVWFEFAHGYGRAIYRVTNEVRANTNDRADPELIAYGVRVRACRNGHVLNGRNDPYNSKQMGRSWKDYTKNKRQWQSKGVIKEQDAHSPWLTFLRSIDPELV
jgi:hypothetical protein